MLSAFLLAAIIPAPVCMASAADTEAIADIIRAWYAAGGAGDAGKFHACVTPDFTIFDEGQRLTADEMIAVARKHLAEEVRTSWTIRAPMVEVDRNSALATFATLAYFGSAGHHQDVNFLESAVPTKDEGKWRIRFFHSTAVPPEKK